MNLPKLSDALLVLDQRVATLTFNRDDLRNALTGSALIDDICTVADWVNCCDEVSVLVMTGAGSAFSSGGNVKDMAERGGDFAGDVAEVATRYRRGIQRIPLALHAVEVPIIAAVNGAAIGAGFDLANMADIRIASTKAKFGETFLNLGIIPGDGGAWFMQRLIGYQQAFELTLSGRIVDAAEAKTLGIVLEVVEPEQLLARAQAMAARFAAQPPKALRVEGVRTESARHRLPHMFAGRAGGEGERQLATTWRGRLGRALQHVDANEAGAYLERIVGPALSEVAHELRERGVPATATTIPDGGGIELRTVSGPLDSPFVYRVEPEQVLVSRYGQRSVRATKDTFTRLQVHLDDGGADYDVMGYTSAQLIHDVLDQYERHLEFVRLADESN